MTTPTPVEEGMRLFDKAVADASISHFPVQAHPHPHDRERMRSHLQAQADRIAELEKAIQLHNKGCEAACNANRAGGACEGYTSRGRTCPNCPLDDVIEVASSKGEPPP